MSRYIKIEDAVFAACKVLDKFGGCKIGPLCPDVGCSEIRDIINTFQMIEIPERHGRLKDYDRIMKEYDEWFSKTENREYENMFYALRMAINGSPTIIPAGRVSDGKTNRQNERFCDAYKDI